MSGVTRQWSTANFLPVRPKPVMTSSAIKSTPCLRQMSATSGQYSSGGTSAPAVEPPIGSAMNAATVSGPAATSAFSTSPAQAVRQLG